MSEAQEVVVGVMGRAHGIRGEVVIDVRTDEPDRRFATGLVLRVENSPRVFTVAGTRDHSGRLLATFAEVADRTAAEQVRGLVLVTDVDPDERPEDTEEFYDRQLVGLRALAVDGAEIGVVGAVLHLLMQDVLEIRTPTGPKLVPFVAEIVPVVNLSAGTLTVADVTGLLADEDAAAGGDEPDED